MRVATYNLYLGADLARVFGVRDRVDLARQAALIHDEVLATDFPARAEAIAALLVREQVDLVGLQEVARWSRTSSSGRAEVWCDFLPVLLAALERAGERYDAHAVNANFRGGGAVSATESMTVEGSNVVLVRRGSGVQVTGERIGDLAPTLRIPTGLDDLVIDVARSWGWVDATLDGRPFRFVTTHTEAYDEGTRNAQRDALLRMVGDPGVPVVLVGDFNAPPSTVGVPAPYVDAWLAVGNDPAAGLTCGQSADLTNRESGLRQRIDYVWVRDAPVHGCRVVGDRPADKTPGGLWPSDHAAVVAEVGL